VAKARICFVELPSLKGIEGSERFFTEVFGWQMTAFGPTYACTTTGDVDLGLQADAEEATAGPLAVIEVDDLEVSLAAVLAAGGSVSKKPFSFPGGRRFHFLDPSGNELAVLEADRAEEQA
jgi:predicted enzyme related to lactoylglutathione lyase